MSREILFRGKRVKDGKWVESQCHLGEMHSGTVTWDFAENTVCQYTGLTDKNGRKIFEGDIVKTKFFGKENGNGQNFADYDIFKIIYKHGTYLLENNSRQFSASYIEDMAGDGGIEVIGNIFDDPELFGGGQEE